MTTINLSEQCSTCIHLEGFADAPDRKPYCKAFKKGIPDKIQLGQFDHTKPYRGDGGIRYERET